MRHIWEDMTYYRPPPFDIWGDVSPLSPRDLRPCYGAAHVSKQVTLTKKRLVKCEGKAKAAGRVCSSCRL